RIEEPYISAPTTLIPGNYVQEGIPVEIPAGQYFVMGDNRPRSSDSREFGPIPRKSIVGQVFFRYFPTNAIGPVENPFEESFRTNAFVFLTLMKVNQGF